LLLAEDIGNGFVLRENGELVAEVLIGEPGMAWPDRARAAHIVRLVRHSAELLQALANETRARGSRRLRARVAVGDSAARALFESAGLRFRGVQQGDALFEQILSSEDTRSPFVPTTYAGGLPVRVLLDNIRSQYNVGSFFRTCDAAGVERLYLCGITSHPPAKSISKTALGAEDRVAWEHSWSAFDVTDAIRAQGCELAAIETSANSADLYDWSPRFPVCVVFGNEIDGVSPEVLDACGLRVRIPMLGVKQSLNVATAGGVVIYELLRKYRMFRENSQR
jgi:tRNA(Leu) C34 or U34 (ribose-2'-O)-methylase TrmL